jgi:hypothetical protein
MNPLEVPIIRGAFDRFRWPLTEFSAAEVAIHDQDRINSVDGFFKGSTLPQAKHVPPGWSSAIKHPA